MMKESGIRFQMLEKESPDLPYGMGSGAAEIFGTSGGVAEAVIRCCTPDKSKNALRTIEHSGIRGTDAVRFAEVTINGRKVRAAIVHGLGSAAKAARSDPGAARCRRTSSRSCPAAPAASAARSPTP